MKAVLFFVLISIQYIEIIQTYLVFLCHQLLSTWSNEVATLSQVVRCNENHCHWLVVGHTQYVEWHLSFVQSLSSVTVKRNTYTWPKLNPLLLYINLCSLGQTNWNSQGEETGQRGRKRKLRVLVSIYRNPNPHYAHSWNTSQVSYFQPDCTALCWTPQCCILYSVWW